MLLVVFVLRTTGCIDVEFGLLQVNAGSNVASGRLIFQCLPRLLLDLSVDKYWVHSATKQRHLDFGHRHFRKSQR